MKKILVIAPHNDDELLGVGGTIIKHINSGNKVYVCIATHGTPPLFSPEGTSRNHLETIKCHAHIGVEKTYFLDFPAVLIDKEDRYKINDEILAVVKEVNPDDVYIPHYGDMQKDHQIIADACMVALRPKYGHQFQHIYAYETMSETAWNVPNVQNEFIPNVYVDISAELPAKLEALKFYETQMGDFPDARSIEAIEHLAKYRGALMHMKAAEAFMLIRQICR